MIKKIFIIIVLCIVVLTAFDFSKVYARPETPEDEQRRYQSNPSSDSSSTSSSASSSSNPFSGGQGFLAQGQSQADEALNEAELKNASDSIYNIVIGIAIILAVVIGIVIGIKFMLASSTEKAEIKELLIPYVMGVIVVFGAIGIWRLAISIFDDF